MYAYFPVMGTASDSEDESPQRSIPTAVTPDSLRLDGRGKQLGTRFISLFHPLRGAF